MPTKKKSASGDGLVSKIVVPIVLAMAIGGASPWWWEKLFGAHPEPSERPPAPSVTAQPQAPSPDPQPKRCRDKSHGIEGYANTFETEQYSHWMGGGYSQDPWCNDVIAKLKGQYPDGQFEVVAKSEESRSTCKPLKCMEYKYYCKVRVKIAPIYFEKASPACQ